MSELLTELQTELAEAKELRVKNETLEARVQELWELSERRRHQISDLRKKNEVLERGAESMSFSEEAFLSTRGATIKFIQRLTPGCTVKILVGGRKVGEATRDTDKAWSRKSLLRVAIRRAMNVGDA